MKSGMKCIMENQQWLIILNVKYTFFFSDFKVLLLHSPTQVQTVGFFFFFLILLVTSLFLTIQAP